MNSCNGQLRSVTFHFFPNKLCLLGSSIYNQQPNEGVPLDFFFAFRVAPAPVAPMATMPRNAQCSGFPAVGPMTPMPCTPLDSLLWPWRLWPPSLHMAPMGRHTLGSASLAVTPMVPTVLLGRDTPGSAFLAVAPMVPTALLGRNTPGSAF